ncbi:hypothetical protein TFLX_02505 [Thermoflexales bacterium]|nr:hypothetical protein TFLX_02505 [Thermoflexales bacterium]
MNEYEVFAKAFRCTPAMAESIVKRVRERVGREVPMSEMLNAIKKIPPTRLSTDTLVIRLQKNSGIKSASRKTSDDEFDDFEIEGATETPGLRTVNSTTRTRTSSRVVAPKRPTGANAQIDQLLQKNWTQARALGMNPPNISVDQFVRQTQSTVGEPKPTVARVLSAVQTLSKKDVLITPNLAADEIIEKDELR